MLTQLSCIFMSKIATPKKIVEKLGRLSKEASVNDNCRLLVGIIQHLKTFLSRRADKKTLV